MMRLQGRRVLLTGAAGFIGSHLAEELVSAGCDVRCLVQYNSRGSRGWLEMLAPEIASAVEIVAGDVRDPHGVRAAVSGCSAVFHLAALIGIPYSYSSPDAYVDTNVRGTLNVLQAARDLGVERVVQTSTSEVYGSAQAVPIGEDHPLNAQSPYAATKIGADQLAISFQRSFELPVAVVRPFNTYGPRQSTRAVIPTIITQIAAGKTTLRLGSTAPTRDFNFVTDTARGFLAAASSDATVGEVVNIGTGYEISIGDTVALIARAMGVDVEIETDDARLRPAASEVERLCADASKLRELTGWRPEYGDAEGLLRGLKVTAEWFADPDNLARARPGEYTV